MEYTEEQLKDIEERREGFLKEYKILQEKWEMDWGQMPIYIPLGNGIFGTRVVIEPMDLKYSAVPSPFKFDDSSKN